MQHPAFAPSKSATPERSRGNHRIASALSAWWRAFRVRRRGRATSRLLYTLSDRTLKDIGIDRSEIASIERTAGEARDPRRFKGAERQSARRRQ